MKVIVGLGNPGSEYEATRHNIGFAVCERFESLLERSSGWRAGKGSYYFAKGWLRTEDVLLVKPTTYMNLSGRAVRDVLQFYKSDVGSLLVLSDDIALPVGQLRLRLKGSDGGHNGITSIIQELGTNEFARLRCGVGSDFRRGEQAKYVLSKFKSGELVSVNDMLLRSEFALRAWVTLDSEIAMNKINADLSGAPPKAPPALNLKASPKTLTSSPEKENKTGEA